ncbi:hypothetical protein [Gryllotalpicola protaetiae]|uniref:Uncharacterized protein n=1 Tax=Gryllotalpicola protaetiae TaxID=2419771 RepID=A0A387BUD1_9MICO|nr:hypothetical protein [Gryllotalpicola protaetiae]AYG04656.1 hypothetical protein D7I44_14750 [Gryllotalpicola protaetiae]
MSNSENDEREKDWGEQDADAAHPFDQTNGIVEGLEGDADSPEEADKKTENVNSTGFLPAPAPGGQMLPGVVPVGTEQEASAEADEPD